MKPTIVDDELLDAASRAARESPRLRRNHNFSRETDACNRLLNAIEPGSYVAPHRHLDAAKDEALLVLRGRIGAVFFDDDGEVAQTALLGPGQGADIPHGCWHTVLALDSGTVFFECKAGPYAPLGAGERAPWAPVEGEAPAGAYLSRLRARFPD